MFNVIRYDPKAEQRKQQQEQATRNKDVVESVETTTSPVTPSSRGKTKRRKSQTPTAAAEIGITTPPPAIRNSQNPNVIDSGEQRQRKQNSNQTILNARNQNRNSSSSDKYNNNNKERHSNNNKRHNNRNDERHASNDHDNNSNNNRTSSSSLHVIAENVTQQPNSKKSLSTLSLHDNDGKRRKTNHPNNSNAKQSTRLLTEEAFDDLDIMNVDELIGDMYGSENNNTPQKYDKNDDAKYHNKNNSSSEYNNSRNQGSKNNDVKRNVTMHSSNETDNINSLSMNQHSVSTDEMRSAMKMSKIAFHNEMIGTTNSNTHWKLESFLMNNLQKNGLTHFFPIQSLVIPDVIASDRHAHIRVYDVCITAPTGSGKTLSYVLPILNSLSKITKQPTSVSPPQSMLPQSSLPPKASTTIASSTASHHRRHLLRALIILPNRDLATQVYNVIESYMIGSDLKVGLAIGQTHFITEQKALVMNDDDSTNTNTFDHYLLLQQRLLLDPCNMDLALKVYRSTTMLSNHGKYSNKSSNGGVGVSSSSSSPKYGWSNIDVLVCTPGRLVDHLDNTPGFTLQHLRYLVIDEADRLLGQSYHNWIDRVIDAANTVSINMWKDIINKGNNKITESTKPMLRQQLSSYQLEPITWRRGGIAGDRSDTYNTNDTYTSCIAASVCQPVQLRKFLVSATLTNDPRKLSSLRLVNPKHFNVHQLKIDSNDGRMTKHDGGEGNDKMDGNTIIGNNSSDNNTKKYAMPDNLHEYFVECTAEQKPLVLLSLILDQLHVADADPEETNERKRSSRRKRVIVVFTSSVDSTHRLARLLQLLWVVAKRDDGCNADDDDTKHDIDSVVEFSSLLKQKERSQLLERVNDANSDISVVVCSDGLSRGMDIQYVDTVINYDVPTLAKTYVHRCGRTARASRNGTAISLLKGGQVSHFHKMRNLIYAPEKVTSMKVKKFLVSHVVPKFGDCVKLLRKVIVAEEDGELNHTDRISSEFLVSSGLM